MLTTRFRVHADTAPPEAVVFRYPDRSPIGGVNLDGNGLEVRATDPHLLFRLADEFAKAAHELRNAVVEFEAQQILDQPQDAA